MYVPPFTDFTRSRVLVSTISIRFTVNPAVTGSSPFRAICIGPVGLFESFSALCDFFSPSNGPTFKFLFDILQQTKVPKSPNGLPFYVFRHYEDVQNCHFSFFFRKSKKFRNLFCLQRAPFTFFDILQQTGFPKNPKGPAFTENLLCRKFISLTLWVDAE